MNNIRTLLILLLAVFSSCDKTKQLADKVNNGLWDTKLNDKKREAAIEELPEYKTMGSNYTGVWKMYSEDSTLISSNTYLNGVRNGISIQYYKNGKPMLETNYLEGEQHGTAKKYYKSGKIYRETPYHNGLIDGVVKKYYDGGELMSESPFKNGYQIFGLKEYTETGQEIKRKPTILIEEIDKLASVKRYIVEISLSKNSGKAKYFVNKLPKETLLATDFKTENGFDKYIVNSLKYQPLPVKNGKGIIDVFAIGGYHFEENIKILVTYETRLRNIDVVEKSINLKISN